MYMYIYWPFKWVFRVDSLIYPMYQRQDPRDLVGHIYKDVKSGEHFLLGGSCVGMPTYSITYVVEYLVLLDTNGISALSSVHPVAIE